MKDKTVNLTIRVSPKLKADAEAACRYLNRSFTKEINRLLTDLVREHWAKRTKDTAAYQMLVEGEVCVMAYAALLEKYQAGGQEMPEHLHRILSKRGGVDE